MTLWLNHFHTLVQNNVSFVLATIWSVDGSSPDSVGARVLVTDSACFGALQSTHRQQTVIEQSREILQSSCNLLQKSYPLGEVAGSANGHCTIFFEKFSGEYPYWLEILWPKIIAGTPVYLANTISGVGSINQSTWYESSVAQPSISHFNAMVDTSNHSRTLVELIKDSGYTKTVAVVGDSAVAVALMDQLSLLPLRILWLRSQIDNDGGYIDKQQVLTDESFDVLPADTYIAIATNNHELDIHCCYLALRNKNIKYTGCIGSQKKAAIVRTRLTAMGITEQQLSCLRIPIGLPTITGKQPAIIAASITAQILSD